MLFGDDYQVLKITHPAKKAATAKVAYNVALALPFTVVEI